MVRIDFRWRQCQCPLLEIFDYLVSSLYPETFPAACQPFIPRISSTGLRLGAEHVVSAAGKQDPACLGSGAGFMA